MGIKRVKLQVKRKYSEEFKKARISEYEKGEFTISEISKLYGIDRHVIYRWIYRYSLYNKKNVKIVELKDSSTTKVKELYNRIKDLERIVGQKQIHIDYLEKMIEIAKDDFGMDIKKNFDTLHSNGSANTSKE